MSNKPPMARLARYAMGTRFEAIILGEDESQALAAGEAAFDEIDYYHSALNLFARDSFLSHLNRRAYEKPVRLAPDLFDLIRLCVEVSEKSRGAFDITVGPLMKSWGFHSNKPDNPHERSSAKAKVGRGRLLLDQKNSSIGFAIPDMRLDFGGVAKGYALDRAMEALVEQGPMSAMIHGGSSAVKASKGKDWRVAIKDPLTKNRVLRIVDLNDSALSVSAQHGRNFKHKGQSFGHVMNPITGEPARGAILTADVCQSAALADAWSTAILAAGPKQIRSFDFEKEKITVLIADEKETTVFGPSPDLFKVPNEESGVLEI